MDIKKERYRRIRGLMLNFLGHCHPGSLDSVHLRFLLDDLGYPMTDEEYESHIAYLSDRTKGYVTRDVNSSGGVSVTHETITPKGLDLLDGFHPESDPGVDVKHL